MKWAGGFRARDKIPHYITHDITNQITLKSLTEGRAPTCVYSQYNIASAPLPQEPGNEAIQYSINSQPAEPFSVVYTVQCEF